MLSVQVFRAVFVKNSDFLSIVLITLVHCKRIERILKVVCVHEYTVCSNSLKKLSNVDGKTGQRTWWTTTTKIKMAEPRLDNLGQWVF